ncbi:helix-turn-helix domain-containing protein [Anaerotignum propionicum]|uniref:helix-turn-helix domain-containing protein n=1 Tax=Anaerotignum propionicum TaxID=28446 RepID=UPI00210B6A34|nr:helix-turn-helix domain-containing protein [Anaerotignum propionicum]MCQ4936329.1 helix-turn-helix domain-containing protein [Anaerotignum propionicum]
MTESKWLTLVEICDYLKVSRETILNWINKKNMPAHKVGRLWRFDVTEVDQWIKSGGAAEERN